MNKNIDVTTDDTIRMLENEIKSTIGEVALTKFDWKYIRGYIKRQLTETFEEGRKTI